MRMAHQRRGHGYGGEPHFLQGIPASLGGVQLTDPDSIPFREELVFVKWSEDPPPEYLKNTSGATLDLSCIFEV